jgi:Flp pilus assembly protein TadB
MVDEGLARKYERRLKKELGEDSEKEDVPRSTRAYQMFKREYLPKHLTLYERACAFSEKILKVSPDKKTIPKLQEAIDICHLDITPSGVASFAILGPLIFIVLGVLVGFMVPFMFGQGGSLFLVVTALLGGLVLMIPLQKLPFYFADAWRLKASNQMVLSIFYIVTYMRHTSNLEKAIDFAADHLAPPLSLDLKKVIWDIETGKFSGVKESLDHYLETWREWNLEYIESMHLIESSLYEPDDARRLNALDKSLSVMLDETYERMLHYAHDLKTPITTLHMLGIILPILGLVILPLVVSFMPEVKWYHLLTLYNIVLPVMVFFLGKQVLNKRPTGYGAMDVGEEHPELKKYENIIIRLDSKHDMQVHPGPVAVFIGVGLLLIAILPLLWHALLASPGCQYDIIVNREFGIEKTCTLGSENARFFFLDYREETIDGKKTGNIVGPYGLGASILSLAWPLALGLSFGYYYRWRSRNVYKLREQSKRLEQEFASALFQLGNRLGDGLPAEIAFAKVADMMRDTTSGQFFGLISSNIRQLGMGMEAAIFDPYRGALRSYPSPLIESTMKVLIESSKKGPRVASQALINVSDYIKQIHRVDERLKDLLADDISSMKSQVRFLMPAIAGIVIGITSMITTILGSLTSRLGALASISEQGGSASILGLFGSGVPTYYFQMIVGIYVVQLVFIMAQLINGIENGADKLNERYILGDYLVKTTMTYVIISLIIMLLFNVIAASIIGSVGTVS